MDPLRILLVDNEADIIAGTETVRIGMRGLPTIEETQAEVGERIAAAQFDLIVIGNCGSAGLYIVPRVPLTYRGVVVVLSTEPLPESRRLPYREMGVTQFCLRGPAFREFVEQRGAAMQHARDAAQTAGTDPSIPVSKASA